MYSRAAGLKIRQLLSAVQLEGSKSLHQKISFARHFHYPDGGVPELHRRLSFRAGLPARERRADCD